MKARRLVTRALPFIAAVVFLAMTASTAFAVTSTLPLTVTSAGKSFAAPSSLITSGSVVDTAGVTAWVNTIASSVYCKMANASYSVDKKHKKLAFKAAKIGYTLNKTGSIALICAALPSAASTTTPTTLALPTTITQPTVTKFGKNILVVKSKCKIYLYDNNRVIKTYRCAVGMKSYPTPAGTFHIGKKVKNPSWHNGYASWSKGMPAYIGPSPNNPLGTRAMYVYTGKKKGGHDTGVRFHGVPHSEDSSIGHAASHGCLRMHRKDVEAFFPLVPMNTVVYIIK